MHVENEQNVKKALIPKSFLQSGNDLQISSSIKFKHPTVQDVIDLDQEHLGLYSESIYYSMVNVFLTDPYTYMVYLYDNGIDYETSSPFNVFILLFKDHLRKIKSLSDSIPKEQLNLIYQNNIYFKAFDFFLGIKNFFVAKDENGNEILGYDKNQFLMDSNMFDYITEFIQKINGIPESEKIYPEDKWAKEMLIDDERDRLKKLATKRENEEADNCDRLGNLLSAVTWSCNGGVTPFTRNQLHMYDLVDGIQRTDKLLNYRNTMVGLYSGCVDRKKIDFNELHWSN